MCALGDSLCHPPSCFGGSSAEADEKTPQPSVPAVFDLRSDYLAGSQRSPQSTFRPERKGGDRRNQQWLRGVWETSLQPCAPGRAGPPGGRVPSLCRARSLRLGLPQASFSASRGGGTGPPALQEGALGDSQGGGAQCLRLEASNRWARCGWRSPGQTQGGRLQRAAAWQEAKPTPFLRALMA